jgi:hypothetical protein
MVNLKVESPTLSVKQSMIGFGGLRLAGDVGVMVVIVSMVLFCLSTGNFAEFCGESDGSAEEKKLCVLNINLLSWLNVHFADSPLNKNPAVYGWGRRLSLF